MNDLGVSFIVQYFPGYYLHVQIPLEHYMRGECHVMHLKQAVGKALNLKEESMNIFGIFAGQLGEPIELCPDHYPLVGNMDLCFQRVPSSKEEELEVINDDERALALVFWEVKYRSENTTIFPRPQNDVRRNMDYQRRFTQMVLSSESLMAQLAQECVHENNRMLKLTNQSMFVEAARKIPAHYMLYSDVIECCVLKHTLATNPPVKKGTKVHIVMDSSKLVVLDLSGQELISWTWDTLVIEDPVKRYLPMWYPMYYPSANQLEMPTEYMDEDDGDEPRRGICFATNRCMYIYSVSVHFQREYYHRGECD